MRILLALLKLAAAIICARFIVQLCRVQQRNCPWLRCKRSQSDEERCSHIQRVWHANWQVYGVVKVWKQMHREGLPIARCTVQRLMRKLGLQGARRKAWQEGAHNPSRHNHAMPARSGQPPVHSSAP